jgi:hypothetical protein
VNELPMQGATASSRYRPSVAVEEQTDLIEQAVRRLLSDRRREHFPQSARRRRADEARARRQRWSD